MGRTVMWLMAAVAVVVAMLPGARSDGLYLADRSQSCTVRCASNLGDTVCSQPGLSGSICPKDILNLASYAKFDQGPALWSDPVQPLVDCVGPRADPTLRGQSTGYQRVTGSTCDAIPGQSCRICFCTASEGKQYVSGVCMSSGGFVFGGCLVLMSVATAVTLRYLHKRRQQRQRAAASKSQELVNVPRSTNPLAAQAAPRGFVERVADAGLVAVVAKDKQTACIVSAQ